MTNYEVTATRKRPRNFNSLIGQNFVVATLLNSLKTGRIAHAYLFSGSRGVGKTSTARILARALNCPDESLLGTEGCFDYEGAEDISKGVSVDVIEIDGASNTSVNDIRAIKDEILFPPQNNRYKIYIIDEVHMLSGSAFNALLKTIEEPPKYVIFIFATTEIHKVPATIRSRCQQFNFRLLSQEEILGLLEETCAESDPPIQAERDALIWIAREAKGSMRDAYTIFDQLSAYTNSEISLKLIKEKLGFLDIEELNNFVQHIISGDFTACTSFLESIYETNTSVEHIIIELSNYFRAILFIRQGVQDGIVFNFQQRKIPEQILRYYTITQLEKILELLLQAYRDIRYTLNEKLELELLISRFLRISKYFEPDEIIEKIEGLQSRILHEIDAPSENLKHSSHTELNSDINEEFWATMIAEFSQKTATLATVLGNCKQWGSRKVGEEHYLDIVVKTAMHSDTIRTNQELICNYIYEKLGISITIEVKTEAENHNMTAVDRVKEIFHGVEISRGDQKNL